MIQTISGKCPSCSNEFGPLDSVQSTQVTCNKCRKQLVLCRKCKEQGCSCGGRLENTFDRNPHLLH